MDVTVVERESDPLQQVKLRGVQNKGVGVGNALGVRVMDKVVGIIQGTTFIEFKNMSVGVVITFPNQNTHCREDIW